MSSPNNFPDLVDHTIRHNLRHSVAHAQPGPAVRQQLLQRAARRCWARFWWPAPSDPVLEYGAPGRSLTPLELGWRELAFMQLLRPAGLFGALCQLR
ncbi:MAG: hypothetical protein NZM11_05045 [Anaerolineales bacterium]|nr:hypothetical protein [Anaerolineales bacterium]